MVAVVVHVICIELFVGCDGSATLPLEWRVYAFWISVHNSAMAAILHRTAGTGGCPAAAAGRVPLISMWDVLLCVGKARNLKKRVELLLPGSAWYAHRPYGRKIARLETTVVRSRKPMRCCLKTTSSSSLNPAIQHSLSRRQELSYLKITGVSAKDGTGSVAGQCYPRAYAYNTAAPWNAIANGLSRRLGGRNDTAAAKVFRLRTCEDTVFANRTRPCLLYQIKLHGPCVGFISTAAYADDVHGAEACCVVKHQELMQVLEQRMLAHSDRLEFELAAEVRNQITALSRVLHQWAD